MKGYNANSRYFGTPTRKTTVDGKEVSYLARRLVPGPERFATLMAIVVQAGDRPDTLAARAIGDPEQYWKIADANVVLHPNELTEVVGRKIRLTLPEGIPATGGDDA